MRHIPSGSSIGRDVREAAKTRGPDGYGREGVVGGPPGVWFAGGAVFWGGAVVEDGGFVLPVWVVASSPHAVSARRAAIGRGVRIRIAYLHFTDARSTGKT